MFKKKDHTHIGIDSETYAELRRMGMEEKVIGFFDLIRTREYNKLIKGDVDKSEQIGVLKGIEMCSQMFKTMHTVHKKT